MSDDDYENERDLREYEMNRELGRAEQRAIERRVRWGMEQRAAAHDHAERVEGCFRCDLSRDEATSQRVEEVAAATGTTPAEVIDSVMAIIGEEER